MECTGVSVLYNLGEEIYQNSICIICYSLNCRIFKVLKTCLILLPFPLSVFTKAAITVSVCPNATVLGLMVTIRPRRSSTPPPLRLPHCTRTLLLDGLVKVSYCKDCLNFLNLFIHKRKKKKMFSKFPMFFSFCLIHKCLNIASLIAECDWCEVFIVLSKLDKMNLLNI